jgi:hypothetical protein
MTRLVSFMCGYKGCEAGSANVDTAGDLWLTFRGQHPARDRWDNDPVPLRLDKPNAWPFITACPHCRRELRVERDLVVDGLTEVKATGKPARRVIPPTPQPNVVP